MTTLFKPLFKAFIVWLMLVAIPFQGFAAAAMPACAPASAIVAGPSAMPPGHCATMDAATHGAGGARHGGAGHGDPHQHGGDKLTCSHCDAGCGGAVMAPPVPAPSVPAETPLAAVFHFTDRPVATVDLALPERPPKTALT